MLLGEMLVNYLYSAVHMAIEKIHVAGAEIYYDAQFLDAKEASEFFERF